MIYAGDTTSGLLRTTYQTLTGGGSGVCAERQVVIDELEIGIQSESVFCLDHMSSIPVPIA